MNLSNRISKLEKLAAAIPEVNPEHVESVLRFFETGDEAALPEGGVDRAVTLMVARAIPDEDAGAYPGIARMAEALGSSRRIQHDCAENWALALLPRLKSLDPAGLPWWIIFSPDFHPGSPGEKAGIVDPTPGESLLANLGVLRCVRIVYSKPPQPADGIEQKRTDS
jgi:hypothetical protein